MFHEDPKYLDLSCGIGRHSINLAKKGYQVVGYDPSPLYIEKAKQSAIDEIAGAQTEIRFYQAEVCKVAEVLLANGESDFNAIIMFDSVGFMGEAQDIQMLTDIFKLAATNCILVTETENRDWIIRNLQPQVNLDFEKLEIHEIWRFNLETSVAESRSKFYEKNPNGTSLCLVLDINTSLRLYSLHELIRIINSAGWKYIKSLGDILTLEPASSEYTRYLDNKPENLKNHAFLHVVQISASIGFHRIPTLTCSNMCQDYMVSRLPLEFVKKLKPRLKYPRPCGV